MAEEFQAGICGDNWSKISSRSVFGSGGGGSTCSAEVFDMMGSYGWPGDVVDMKPRLSSCIGTNSFSDGSIVFQDAQKPPQQTDFMDSTLQIMGFGLSPSSASDWNQSFLYDSGIILQEDMNSKLTEIDSSQIQKEFPVGSEDSAANAFNPLITDDFIVSSPGTCPAICQGSSPCFPVVSSSPSYGYHQPMMLNSLLNHELQPQHSLYDNGSMSASYEMNSNGFSPSDLHYNITPFSDASTTVVNNSLPTLLPSAGQANFLGSKFEVENKNNFKQVGDVKKIDNDPSPLLKRPRIATPSPLPIFKVRKEKLGDRITALQQLVSPFGKTDTASVLQEAIEYIKFLHDQVNTLSTPYIKNGVANTQQKKGCEQIKGTKEAELQDLRSRGLCLVPLSSTFPVASETTADFWTPTFGGPLSMQIAWLYEYPKKKLRVTLQKWTSRR